MTKHFFLKPFLISILFAVTNQVSFAQGPFGESVLPDPLKSIEQSFYPSIKKGIKSFVYVIDKDTISKSFYDKVGNETSKLEEFRGNKALYKSVHKYINGNKTETSFYVKDILQSKTSYNYSAANLIEWKRIKYTNDGRSGAVVSVPDVHWFLEYAKDNSIRTAYSVDAANVKNQVYDYTYNVDNRLIETNELQWKDIYEYQDGLITKKNRIFKNDGSMYDSVKFTYNDKHSLIEKTDKIYVTQYRYDAGKLSHLHYQKKANAAAMDIDFIYANNQLIKIDILSRDIQLSGPNAGFIFKSDYLSNSWKRNEQNKISLEFFYDKMQLVKEIKYFINEQFKYSKFFLYEYY